MTILRLAPVTEKGHHVSGLVEVTHLELLRLDLSKEFSTLQCDVTSVYNLNWANLLCFLYIEWCEFLSPHQELPIG